MLDELRELYQEVILDHGKNPRNCYPLEGASHMAHGNNPMCGDTLDIFLKVDDADSIADVTFVGRGCAISVASASMMTEILKGKSVAEAQQISRDFQSMCTEDDFNFPEASEAIDEDAVERLQMLSGVKEFPVRVKCATLAWHTMNAAVVDGGEEVTTDQQDKIMNDDVMQNQPMPYDDHMFAPAEELQEYTAQAGGPLLEGVEVATQSELIEAMRSVYDPEIPVNIYDLGLIYTHDITEKGDVAITMSLTAPGCPVAGEMPGMVADAAAKVEGLGVIDVKIVWEPTWTQDLMSEDAKLALGMFQATLGLTRTESKEYG